MASSSTERRPVSKHARPDTVSAAVDVMHNVFDPPNPPERRASYLSESNEQIKAKLRIMLGAAYKESTTPCGVELWHGIETASKRRTSLMELQDAKQRKIKCPMILKYRTNWQHLLLCCLKTHILEIHEHASKQISKPTLPKTTIVCATKGIRGVLTKGVHIDTLVWLLSNGALANVSELIINHELCSIKISDVGLSTLADTITKGFLPLLKTLNLSNNNIGDSGIASFSDIRGTLPQLQTLYLEYNNIGDSGLASLADTIARDSFPRLKKLDLGHNNIGSLTSLAEASGSLAHLTYLNLCCNQIRAPQLLFVKGSFPQLFHLILSSNPFGDAELKAVILAVFSGGSVNVLNARGSNVTAGGWYIACESTRARNITLTA